jgi:hypothetical protein
MTKTPRPLYDAPDSAKGGPPPGVTAESGSGKPNPTLAMTVKKSSAVRLMSC